MWSKRIQEKSSLLADYGQINADVSPTFKTLMFKNGAYLTNYLSDVGFQNFDTYYGNTNVYFKSIKLINDATTGVHRLDTIRVKCLEKIIDEINDYFPEGPAKRFDIFRPRNLPTSIGETSTGTWNGRIHLDVQIFQVERGRR